MTLPTEHPQRHLMLAARALAQACIGRDGVIGVDVGTKYRSGRPQRELAIRFLVNEKHSPSMLRRMRRRTLPKTVVVTGRRVHTDVLQACPVPHYSVIDEIPALDERKQVLDPVRPGCSVGGRMGDAGTLGMIVYDRENGEALALSNWHVLDLGGGVGAEVHQPGPFDLTPSPSTLLGGLVRSHRGLAGDCAVTRIVGRGIDASVLGIDTTPVRIGDPEHGDAVVKSGRTSGVTQGVIDGVGLTMGIQYGGLHVLLGGVMTINPAAGTDNLARGGDSGSLWIAMDDDHPTDVALGLHFGGDEKRRVAYACAMRPIMTKLNILPAPP